MRKIWFLFWVLLLTFVAISEAATLKVSIGQITSAIEKQMPVDNVSKYPADYGKLFCFTRVVGADKETTVTHVW